MPLASPNHWKLGLFVVGGAALMLAIAVWLGARRFERQTFLTHSYFDEPVTGLELGSPVRFRGMTIGSVVDIRAAKDRHHLDVQAAIDVQKLEQLRLREPGEIDREGVVIPFNLRARIERSFVTGVAFVQTDFFETERYPIPRYPFEVNLYTIHSVPSSQKNFERGIEDLLVYVPDLVLSLKALTNEVNIALEGADVSGTMLALRETFDEVKRVAKSIDWQAIDRQARTSLESASKSAAELQQLIADLRNPEGALQSTFVDARRLLERLSEAVASSEVPTLARSIRRLSDELAVLGDDASGTLDTMRRAADAVRELSELLERDPAALLRGREANPDPRTRR